MMKPIDEKLHPRLNSIQTDGRIKLSENDSVSLTERNEALSKTVLFNCIEEGVKKISVDIGTEAEKE